MDRGRPGTRGMMGTLVFYVLHYFHRSLSAGVGRTSCIISCGVQKGKHWTELMVDLGKSRSMARDGREEKARTR
jgi:hypothetical protein